MFSGIRQRIRRSQDLQAILIITAVFAVMAFITLFSFSDIYIWGSRLDWCSQHFALPEYLRRRFYETGDVFPDFAMQIGAGQNIYNFAYYGIANPLYLPAYAMPFMTMATYMQLLGMAVSLGSSIISYYFFKRHFSGRLPLILALMFLCCGPLIFHSHRHIMFVDYFPFLFGLLFGAGGKDSAKNLFFLAVMSCCMVCTSFYYSVGTFAAVGAYMIFLQLESQEAPKLMSIISAIWKKVLFCGLGCLCAAFLWLPTLTAILSGRAATSVSISLKELLIPTVDLSMLLYTPYSAGLSSFCAVAFIALLMNGRRSERFLSAVMACCVIFPVIVYIFNGTMYVDGKALIPLAPLLLLLCGRFFQYFEANKVRVRATLIIFLAAAVLSLILNSFTVLVTVMIVADTLITAAIVLICVKIDRRKAAVTASLGCSLLICVINCFRDGLVDIGTIRELYSPDIRYLVDDVLDSDRDGLYRFAEDAKMDETVNTVYRTDFLTTNIYSSLSNSEYRDFRFYESGCEIANRNNAITLQPQNIVFSSLMGCRYRLDGRGMPQYGEEIYSERGGYRIWKNKNVLPLGYASSDVMSESVFLSLPYEQRHEALLKNIIVPDGSYNGILPESTVPYDIDFELAADGEDIVYEDGVFTVDMYSEKKVSLPLEEPLEDKLLIIMCETDNDIDPSRYGDVILEINTVANKLTDPTWKYKNLNYSFTYLISSAEPIEKLDLRFTPGLYRISGLRAYTLDASVLENAGNNKDSFEIVRGDSVGDTVRGDIDVTADGWFNMSFPYDEGFRITVDGKETEYEKTNTAFIGFPISAGHHEIEITYEAPGKAAGIRITVVSVLITALLLTGVYIADKKKKAA